MVKASVEKDEQMVNWEGISARLSLASTAKSVIPSSDEAIKGPRPVSSAFMQNMGGRKMKPRYKSPE